MASAANKKRFRRWSSMVCDVLEMGVLNGALLCVFAFIGNMFCSCLMFWITSSVILASVGSSEFSLFPPTSMRSGTMRATVVASVSAKSTNVVSIGDALLGSSVVSNKLSKACVRSVGIVFSWVAAAVSVTVVVAGNVVRCKIFVLVRRKIGTRDASRRCVGLGLTVVVVLVVVVGAGVVVVRSDCLLSDILNWDP